MRSKILTPKTRLLRKAAHLETEFPLGNSFSKLPFPNSLAHRRAGFGIIEIIIACAMTVTALAAFSQAASLGLRLLRSQKNALEATLLAEEALEASRSVRDESWNAVAALTDTQNPSPLYYPVIQNGKWILTLASPGLVNGVYNRSVQFEKVNRDPTSSKIVTSGGTADAGTRKVTASVSSSAVNVQLVSYLTDFQSYLTSASEAVSVSYTDASADTNLAGFPSQNAGDGDPGQSFTAAGAVKVTMISVPLRRATAAPSDVYLELRTSPNGAVLGTSQIITGTTASANYVWTDFRFPGPVLLAAGTYTIRLRSIPYSTVADSGSAGYLYWQYGSSNPYGGGTARRYIGRLGPGDDGQALTEDFGFKIYALQ